MRTNHVGRTDLKVTALGLGTAQLGDLYSPLSEDDCTSIVDAAWAAGIRYFDTAPHYGLGLSETRLGRALHGRPRHQYVLSSKVGRLIRTRRSPDASRYRQWDFSADGVKRSIDESLQRLDVDRIDIALIHDPQGHLRDALDLAYPALEQLKSEGMVKAIGVGSGNLYALQAFADKTDIDVEMIAGRYTLLEQPAARKLLPALVRRGISILNAGVFNTGLLANEDPTSDSRYEYAPVEPERLRRARRLAEVARQFGTSLPAAALHFAGLSDSVASVVVGADDPSQVRRNADLFNQAQPSQAMWRELTSQHLIH